MLVAHNASFDRRVLAQAFERAGIDWPDPPVLCTVALARKCAPLVRQRKLALLADALGIEVDVVHRALPDATTCARILCALFPRLCAAAPTVADAVAAAAARRGAGRQRPAAPRRTAAARGPAGPEAPAQGPGRVRVPRRARAAAVRGQVGLAAHARAGALLCSRRLDRAGRGGRLQTHQLRAGRAGAGEPADQTVAPAGQQGAQAHRQVGLRALPAGRGVPGARGLGRARDRGAP